MLYTSGSTGKPKGVVHTTGGYMVRDGVHGWDARCVRIACSRVFDSLEQTLEERRVLLWFTRCFEGQCGSCWGAGDHARPKKE